MPLHFPRFSADGRRVAVTVAGAKNNVWLYNIERGLATRVTNGRYHEPLWTADGHLVMSKGPPGDMDLVRRSADQDGVEEVLVPSGQAHRPRLDLRRPSRVSASDRDRRVGHPRLRSRHRRGLADRGDSGVRGTAAHFTRLSLGHVPHAPPSNAASPSPRPPSPPLPTLPSSPPLSPGRWMSYTSDESGRDEVYVRGLGQRTPRQQVSTNNAIASAWAPDGRTLYFVTRFKRSLWAASIATSPALSVGRPRRLFDLEGYQSFFDVSPGWEAFPRAQRPSAAARPPRAGGQRARVDRHAAVSSKRLRRDTLLLTLAALPVTVVSQQFGCGIP